MSGNKGKLTPLMKQYWEVKEQHQDKVLMFRMGDFFEMFHDDARIAAPILEIALTQRNKKSEDDTPMCGMPHFSIATPIAKLLAAGHKVAICDQIEDPKEAKGLVKRAVTRILSPGMVFDPETLDQLNANYLCSYDKEYLSFLDSSTGEAISYKLRPGSERDRVRKLLAPVEIVVSSEEKARTLKEGDLEGLCVTAFDGAGSKIAERFDSAPESAQRLVAYAKYMQGAEVEETIRNFEIKSLASHMELGETVLRHLEIFETYKKDGSGSLFKSLNRTKTSIGARLLKDWLKFPLLDEQRIRARLDQVEKWTKEPGRLKEMRGAISGVGDVERRMSKVLSPQGMVRDLMSLSSSLRSGLAVTPFCDGVEESQVGVVEALVQRIDRTIVDEVPSNEKNGGFINKGLFSELDDLIKLTDEGQTLLQELEDREKQATGIPSLKVRYNNVFGYYLEVTKTHSDKVPKHYVRKQTLTNAERYITDELHQLEGKMLSAKSKRLQLEWEIFSDLKKLVQKASVEILTLARKWAELDVYGGLAWLALEHNYRRPSFSKAGALDLRNSRHPVVEQESSKPFVPNTIQLQKGHSLLLTGPNMAGKSTLMRQVAVISMMAQLGSFVPAEQAILPLYDRIFTRIGATDYLSEGLSTFMVEMKETADMLSQSTQNSLVILDEVGRGTSTYDGMSLAQSILEHLVQKTGCMALFATHYHELTQMAYQHPQISNGHMSIRDSGGKGEDLVFLYTLKEGPANKSYGIHVAELAGLPKKVTQRAKALLERLESFQPTGSSQMSLLQAPVDQAEEFEVTDSLGSVAEAVNPAWEELIEEIKATPIQQLTPLEAMNRIAQWQSSLS